MMQFTIRWLVCISLLALVSGCTTTGKKVSATPAAVPIVALAFLTNKDFGSGLTDTDRAALSSAESQALDYGRSGEEIGWKGQSAAVGGVIIAYQPFRVGKSNCRRFEHRLTALGAVEKTDGTACRRDEGDWQLVR